MLTEQLDQFALIAKDYAYVTVRNYKDKSQEFEQAYLEKFAELIVQECAEVAHCNFHVDGLTLGSILKEHFGVKII